MDILNNINSNLMTPIVSDEAVRQKGGSQAPKEQFAKDFESIFIEKLLDEMKNTIGSWGFEQDAASKQIQGLFWMHLARDVSKNGGLGMWKDIYQSLNPAEDKTQTTNTLNDEL